MKPALLAVLAGCASEAHAAPALETLQQLQGTYTGRWEFYALDASGSPVKTYSATDTATTGKPERHGERVFVAVHDVMQLPGRELALDFREGYLIKPDGSAGDRFFEMFGQTVVENRIGEQAWAYQTPVAPQELESLGFKGLAVISAIHTTLKTSSIHGHTETELVTRVTTVHWNPADGPIKSAQFVSMSGIHTREVAR